MNLMLGIVAIISLIVGFTTKLTIDYITDKKIERSLK